MRSNFFEFISLHYGEEKKEKVLDNVKFNTSFRGSNLWILACAIVIASVGLNINSTAVIIGAMLISPLMGPIVGAGFALAIFDFDLLKKSTKNLLIATVVGLVVATIYFSISPFKETQPEILARTTPNIYDVLIAFFGGLVGVIALTRVEKGNPIPGVAIATALMPPLCTAGYGLAVGNFSYFLGAFYLYAINCFFICISTYLIVKYLKYSPVKILDRKFEKQIKYTITGLILIMIIPSSYIAYNLYEKKKYSQTVDQFITNEFSNNGCTLIYKRIRHNTNPKKIELAFLTKRFENAEIEMLKNKLIKYNIFNTELEIMQDNYDIKSEILNELGVQEKVLSDKEIKILNLQNELNDYKINQNEILEEITILFPELIDVSIGKHIQKSNTDSIQGTTVLLYSTSENSSNIDLIKIKNWLTQRLKTSEIILVKQHTQKSNN